MTRSFVVTGFMVALAVAALTATAQGQLYTVPAAGNSQDDFTIALSGALGDHQSFYMAVLAAQPTTTTARLLALVRDQSVAPTVRGNAVVLLGFLLDSTAAVELLAIVEGAGPLSVIAREALQMFPQGHVCEYWRRILRDQSLLPRSGPRYYAMSGISFCGGVADIPLVERAALAAGPGMIEAAEQFYIPRLRMPMAERYGGSLLEGNYPPRGTYRMPEYAIQRVNEMLCSGPCPSGTAVSPSELARIRTIDAQRH